MSPGLVRKNNVSPPRPRLGAAFNGVSYSIPGDNHRYNLPGAGTFAQSDGFTGDIEVWPAGNLYSKTSFPEVDGKMKAKPKILLQLEQFLEHELNLPHISREGPSEERLQIYREAFEYLLEDFRTFRPIMSRIKFEYEYHLDHYRNDAAMLIPLKNRLATMQQENRQFFERLKVDHNSEIAYLTEKVEFYEVELKKVKQSEEALRKELDACKKENYSLDQKWREYHEQNKALVSALRNQDMLEKERRQEIDAQRNSYGNVLTAFEKLKVQHEDMQKEVVQSKQKMFATLEELAAKVEESSRLKSQLEFNKRAYQTLNTEYAHVSAVYKEKLAEEAEKQRYSPRPDWSDVAQYIDGLGKAAAGKSSKELVHLLYKEIEKLRKMLGASTIWEGGGRPWVGLGLRALVAPHLRWRGRIPFKRLDRNDLDPIIRECFEQRAQNMKDKGGLSSVLEKVVRKRYADAAAAAQFTYSFLFAVDRYRDVDCYLFTSVLNGDVGEGAHQEQVAVVTSLKQHIVSTARDKYGGAGIPKGDLVQILRSLYPAKSDLDINHLLRALHADQSGEVVNVDRLFEPDEHGRSRPFLSMFREQHLLEIFEFWVEIEDAVAALESKGTARTTGLAVRQALVDLDPQKSEAEWEPLLCRGFNCKPSDLTARYAKPCSATDFMKRARGHIITRTGPPPVATPT